MSLLGTVGGVVQPVLVVAGSPVLVGMMRQVRARLEGRAGPGVWQPWRDLRKRLRKERITPRGTSEVFRFAPLVLVATTLVVAVVVPFVATESALDPVADLFAVVALLALGAVALGGASAGYVAAGGAASGKHAFGLVRRQAPRNESLPSAIDRQRAEPREVM